MNGLTGMAVRRVLVAGCLMVPAAAAQAEQGVVPDMKSAAPAAQQSETAGSIFGVPVSTGNYMFAKRVAYMFPRPWEQNADAEKREQFIWEALILHYEAYRQGVAATDAELTQRINEVLRREKQSFTRTGDPDAYAAWVEERMSVDVELFENQMKYMLEVDLLKDKMRDSFAVTVTDQEMQEEFINEKHHVGGEMVTFDELDAAQAFYEEFKEPAAWDAMKEGGEHSAQPVSMMTLEAYIALWSIPRETILAFHASEIGTVWSPMPFGTQWCVYRLLEKKTGDLADFPDERDSYHRQLTQQKRHKALQAWIEELKERASLTITLPES